jgi:hypothetical protein
MTEAQKRAVEKYRKSAKGRAATKRANRRYETTGKAILRRRNYLFSFLGQEAKSRALWKKKIFK